MALRIAPSILSADFANLERDIAKVADGDLLHVDVMDAHFVPNMTLGLPVVKRIAEVSPLPLDVHLMIDDPDHWAARYAARHPNLALLDLSSFKCGHDAPTYGIIDNIVKTAKVPYSALHDLDANKPGGSILIRVETTIHKLKLVEEELADRAKRRVELARRVAAKRRELLEQLRTRREESAHVG